MSRSDFPWREVLIGDLRLSFEGALVAVIGAIYVGFGLATAGRRSAIVETIGGVTMLVLATVGAAQAPWLLVLALMLHGFWDIAHHGGRITPSVPQWYRRSAPRPISCSPVSSRASTDGRPGRAATPSETASPAPAGP